MTTWRELRKTLNISKEEEDMIEIEKERLKTKAKIREEQGLSQGIYGVRGYPFTS